MNYNKTDKGIEIADTSEILKDLQGAWKSAFPGINMDPSTPQGQINTALVDFIVTANKDIVEHSNSFKDGGNGVYLDIRNKGLFGLIRKNASKGSVTVLISGKSGTSLPIGFKADDNKGNEYELISSYTISAEGSCYAEMIACNDGDYTIEANTLTNIITKIEGVDSINNPFASIKGSNTETDAEFRLRANESINYQASGTYDSLLAKIKQIQGVQKVSGRENFSNNIEVYKGITIQPHSINTVIKGGDIRLIGEVMQKFKVPGVYVGGDVTVDIYAPNVDQTYTMRFYRPIPKELKADLKVIINALTSQDYATLLKDQIISIIDVHKINNDIIPLEILAQVGLENVKIVSFGIGLKDGNTGIEPITLEFKEEAVIKAENIQVSLYE